jgi:1-acyl-sn-glycerol-3-phosphate acyltransferase
MTDWQTASMQTTEPASPRTKLRMALRGASLGGVAVLGMTILLPLRLIERPFFGARRPLSPGVARWVCKTALRILGLRVSVVGTPMKRPGATVANHVSWLDILVLNAFENVYFVSKSEVAGWAFIGWLARATGTLFIARTGTQAKIQQKQFESRLQEGHRLLFFPEGTSSDGQRVLPFKSTLFAAFFHPALADRQHVQPVTLVYSAPKGQDVRFYGWWGDMEFTSSFRAVLGQAPQGRARLIYHKPLRVADFPDRKALAAACEAAIRGHHPAAKAD